MLIDKPTGLTSHDVVARVRRVLGTKAVGHTGTLDPFATGLLVIVLGRATRLARFVEPERKTYRAEVCLGSQTDTDDRTGQAMTTWSGDWPSAPTVRAALAEFLGEQLQRPPEYSAKHVGGERSYRLARRGKSVELASVLVEIYGLTLVEYTPPLVRIEIEVGAGTYIRAVARDLGARLGTGAHLTELRRTRVGSFDVKDAVELERLGADSPRLSALDLLPEFPRVELAPSERDDVRHGRSVPRPDLSAEHLALIFEGQLVAVGRRDGALARPIVVLEAA